jgi:hypothetical protein
VIEHVRAVVAARCGITLRTEVRLLGFEGGETGAVPEPEPERPKVSGSDVAGSGGAE